MPTGYTCDVQNGKITDLREFAMVCARAFGATITMRDDPADAPIPETFEPDTSYYDQRIAEAQATLDELNTLTGEQREARAEAAYRAAVRSHNEAFDRRNEQRQRYEAMIAKVEAWKAPASHAEMKAFMLDQLRESVRFDCGYEMEPPKDMTGDEWWREQRDAAVRQLSYATEHRAKEISMAAERTRWVSELRASLTTPSL